jgi:hypothetical protein
VALELVPETSTTQRDPNQQITEHILTRFPSVAVVSGKLVKATQGDGTKLAEKNP